MFRVMIADDEVYARQKLRRLLSAVPDVEIVAECAEGDSALNQIVTQKPEIIFLDIEMPGRSTFDILHQAVDPGTTCVIFTTAYDRYAVRAFEAEATDFLLKPFDLERLNKALGRARRALTPQKAAVPQIAEASVPMDAPTAPDEFAYLDNSNRLVVRTSDRLVLVKPSDLIWVEAAANYVRLNLRSERVFQTRLTMKELEQKLDRNLFVRIHRSFIVNIERVRELQLCGHGEYLVVLQDGKSLPLGRSYRSRLAHLLSRQL